MEKLFTAVCTVSVEIADNADVDQNELTKALENAVSIDLATEESENTFGSKDEFPVGSISGVCLDWETLTPARKPAIQVWRYDDAPDELKYRSHHSGDEDWVALVPKELVTPNPENLWIPWLEQGHFGNDVQQETLEDGSVLFISAHA